MSKFESALARSAGTDKDREAWLAARRTGVTATEAKKLIMAVDATARKAVMKQLAVEKIEGSAFAGNHFTVWGQLREPVILSELASRYGFRECGHLIKAEANPRHMATPDGWGTDFERGDVLVEIKTSTNDKRLGAQAFDKAGYFYQMQWQMYCAGFDRVAYVVEQHDNDFSRWDSVDRSTWGMDYGPAVQDISVEWVDRDQAVIGKMIQYADEFLAYYDSVLASDDDAGDAVVGGRDAELQQLADMVRDARMHEAEWKAKKVEAWDRLLAIGAEIGDFAGATERGKFSYTAPVTEAVEVWDEEAAAKAFPKEWKQLQRAVDRAEKLKAAFADLSAACVRQETVTGRPRLTVAAERKENKKKEDVSNV